MKQKKEEKLNIQCISYTPVGQFTGGENYNVTPTITVSDGDSDPRVGIDYTPVNNPTLTTQTRLGTDNTGVKDPNITTPIRVGMNYTPVSGSTLTTQTKSETESSDPNVTTPTSLGTDNRGFSDTNINIPINVETGTTPVSDPSTATRVEMRVKNRDTSSNKKSEDDQTDQEFLDWVNTQFMKVAGEDNSISKQQFTKALGIKNVSEFSK